MAQIGRLLGRFKDVEPKPTSELYGLCDEFVGSYRFALDIHATLSMLPQGNMAEEIVTESKEACAKLQKVFIELYKDAMEIRKEIKPSFEANKETYDREKENFYTRREELKKNERIRTLVGEFLSAHATCLALATVLLKHKPSDIPLAVPKKEPLKPGSLEDALGDINVLFGTNFGKTHGDK